MQQVGPAYTMDHESRTMSEKTLYKAFGPLTRCKPNVDHEERPCTKKWMCWFFIFLNIRPRMAIFEKKRKSGLTILLPPLVFIVSSPKNESSENYLNNISPTRTPACSHWSTSFASPTPKPVGPRHRITQPLLNTRLPETSNPTVTLTLISLA